MVVIRADVTGASAGWGDSALDDVDWTCRSDSLMMDLRLLSSSNDPGLGLNLLLLSYDLLLPWAVLNTGFLKCYLTDLLRRPDLGQQ